MKKFIAYFLKPYSEMNLLIRTRANNLFWVLIIFVIGMAAMSVMTALNNNVLLPIVQAGISLGFFGAWLLLGRGKFQASAFFTFILLVAAAESGAILNRSGAIEADIYQTVALFALGISITGAFARTSLYSILFTILGFVSIIITFLIPTDTTHLQMTIAQVNTDANPVAIIFIYILAGSIGTFNAYQYDWILRSMLKAQQTIEAHNETLVQTVADRTAAIRNLLDTTGQGFLSFGKDLIVLPEFSKGCLNLFKRSPAGFRIDQLLYPKQGEVANDFVQGLTVYFNGQAKASVIFDLLDKTISLGDRIVAVEYRESVNQTLLCVLTDVTLEKALADRNKHETERQILVFRALSHKLYFSAFLQEAEQLFEAIKLHENQADNDALHELLRHVHTFKSNSGFFGFNLTHEQAHTFEFALSDSLVLKNTLDLKASVLELKRAYYQELKVITDTLGKNWLEEAGGIVIARNVYDQLSKYVRQHYRTDIKLIQYLEHYRKVPLKDLFSRFPYIAAASAEKLGKKIRPLVLRGGDFRVIPERYEDLAEACIHIVNNMVDHGIEFTFEREAHMKDPAGNLEIELKRTELALILSFEDDGAGISLAEVERQARAKGLIKEQVKLEPAELYDLLFHDGFSTREEITNVSGRGVGLAAVKAEVESLSGTISITSKSGKGTRFEITLPLGARKTPVKAKAGQVPERSQT